MGLTCGIFQVAFKIFPRKTQFNAPRGCCVDIHGNAVCCTTMLGRYWWVIAVSLTIYLVTKVTMMVRRYRAMPDIGEERLEEDRALKVRVRRMTYCC